MSVGLPAVRPGWMPWACLAGSFTVYRLRPTWLHKAQSSGDWGSLGIIGWPRMLTYVYLFPGSVHQKGLKTLLTEINILSVQIFVSKQHSPLKKARAPRTNDWIQIWGRESTRRAWNILCQKTTMCSKVNGAMSKGPRNQCELPSSDQTWGQFQHQKELVS